MSQKSNRFSNEEKTVTRERARELSGKLDGENAPTLSPKSWYGMSAYANKFKYRFSTLGFNDAANLGEDKMWPTAFAQKKLTTIEEAKIVALIKKAIKIIKTEYM